MLAQHNIVQGWGEGGNCWGSQKHAQIARFWWFWLRVWHKGPPAAPPSPSPPPSPGILGLFWDTQPATHSMSTLDLVWARAQPWSVIWWACWGWWLSGVSVFWFLGFSLKVFLVFSLPDLVFAPSLHISPAIDLPQGHEANHCHRALSSSLAMSHDWQNLLRIQSFMTNQVSSNVTIRNASYQVAPTMLAPTMWKINLVHHGIWPQVAPTMLAPTMWKINNLVHHGIWPDWPVLPGNMKKCEGIGPGSSRSICISFRWRLHKEILRNWPKKLNE